MADFATLRAYISQDDPAAAERMADRILHDIETQLPANPRMGRPGRVPSTRELVILKTPYIVPYRIEGRLSRSCASTTALAAGRRDSELSRSN